MKNWKGKVREISVANPAWWFRWLKGKEGSRAGFSSRLESQPEIFALHTPAIFRFFVETPGENIFYGKLAFDTGAKASEREREGERICWYACPYPASFRGVAKALRIAKAANIAKFSHHPASYLLSLRLFPRLLSPASDFCSQREVFPVYIMLPSSSRQPTLLSFPSPPNRLIRFPRIQIRSGGKNGRRIGTSNLEIAVELRQPATFPAIFATDPS